MRLPLLPDRTWQAWAQTIPDRRIADGSPYRGGRCCASTRWRRWGWFLALRRACRWELAPLEYRLRFAVLQAIRAHPSPTALRCATVCPRHESPAVALPDHAPDRGLHSGNLSLSQG